MAKHGFVAGLRRIANGAEYAGWNHGSISRIGRGVAIHFQPGILDHRMIEALHNATKFPNLVWLLVSDEGREGILELRRVEFPRDLRSEYECIFRIILIGKYPVWTMGTYKDAARALLRVWTEGNDGVAD